MSLKKEKSGRRSIKVEAEVPGSARKSGRQLQQDVAARPGLCRPRAVS